MLEYCGVLSVIGVTQSLIHSSTRCGEKELYKQKVKKGLKRKFGFGDK